MQTLKYKVEIVTPAFPGGAYSQDDPKAAEEFEGVRPTSIVYGMRWWFRALAGAIVGTTDLKYLRNAEARLFGTAQDEGRKSRVLVAVRRNVDLHDCRPFDEKDLALRYLAYGLYPTKKGDSWRRVFIPPGEMFEFDLAITRPRTMDDPTDVSKLAGLLAELWIDFGGLGARWRHGLGGMRSAGSALPVADNYGTIAARKIGGARDEMRSFLNTIGLPTKQAAKALASSLPSYPIADAPFLRMAWTNEGGADWRSALKTIHRVWREDRMRNPMDPRSSSKNANLYASFLRGEDLRGRRAELAGLGLPIPFGFPQGARDIPRGSAGHLKPSGTLDKKELERRPSPVWFRVVRVKSAQGERCGLLAFLWRSVYLPAEAGVMLATAENNPARREPEQVAYSDTDAEVWFNEFLPKSQYRFRML